MVLATLGCQAGLDVPRPQGIGTPVDTPDEGDDSAPETGPTDFVMIPPLSVPNQMQGAVTRSQSERFVNVGGLSSSGGGTARGEKYQAVNVQFGFAELAMGATP